MMKRVEEEEDDRFQVVLCYDVSRWGRFQETDLSALYDAQCSQQGKKVIFTTDTSLFPIHPPVAFVNRGASWPHDGKTQVESVYTAHGMVNENNEADIVNIQWEGKNHASDGCDTSLSRHCQKREVINSKTGRRLNGGTKRIGAFFRSAPDPASSAQVSRFFHRKENRENVQKYPDDLTPFLFPAAGHFGFRRVL